MTGLSRTGQHYLKKKDKPGCKALENPLKYAENELYLSGEIIVTINGKENFKNEVSVIK